MCACNKGKNNLNKNLSKLSSPRINPNGASPVQPSVPNQGMVNLPPPPRMDAAAIRRVKQLNKDAIRRILGK